MSSVEIVFDCLPLRSIGRLDVPLDASAGYRRRCERIKESLNRHGAENTYYLANAHCSFRLANSEVTGLLRFEFEGTVKTDPSDARAETVDLWVQLTASTCDWLTEPVTAWFEQTVHRAVGIEFDRYITSGGLARQVDRMHDVDAQQAARNSFLGMHL
jgi:hypothetical protein